MTFNFSNKDYTWEFCLEIYQFLELSRMHLSFNAVEISSDCLYIRFVIPPFEINREEAKRVLEPSNAMKAYYSLYLWAKENKMDYEKWSSSNFSFLTKIDYYHASKYMVNDWVMWKDGMWSRRYGESYIIVPVTILLNKEFLEIMRLLYRDIAIQAE